MTGRFKLKTVFLVVFPAELTLSKSAITRKTSKVIRKTNNIIILYIRYNIFVAIAETMYCTHEYPRIFCCRLKRPRRWRPAACGVKYYIILFRIWILEKHTHVDYRVSRCILYQLYQEWPNGGWTLTGSQTSRSEQIDRFSN